MTTSGAINIPQTSELVTSTSAAEKKQEIDAKGSPISKNIEKQTAPSTPAHVIAEKENEVVEPISFAQLKKSIIDFKDYNQVS